MNTVEWRSPVKNARWVKSWRIGEWLQGPVTPLFETLILPFLIKGREAGGIKHLQWKLPRGYKMKKPSYCILNGYFFARADINKFSFIKFFLFGVTRIEALMKIFLKTSLPEYKKRFSILSDFSCSAATLNDLLLNLAELLEDMAAWWHVVGLDSGGLGYLEHGFKKLYSALSRNMAPLEDILWSEQSPHWQAEKFLYAIIDEILSNPAIVCLINTKSPGEVITELELTAEGRILQEKLKEYGTRFGYQFLSLDISLPSLEEKPELIIPLLKKYISSDSEDPGERLQKLYARREKAKSKIEATLPKRSVIKIIIKKMLHRCETLVERKENTFYHFTRLFPLLRQNLLEIGSRFVMHSLLCVSSDIFFLTANEIRNYCALLTRNEKIPVNIQKIISSRKKILDWQKTLTAPPLIPIENDNNQAGSPLPEKVTDIIKGLGASSGLAYGQAKIVTDILDIENFNKGEILVIKSLSPVWTPFFSLASAIISDAGGITCHASLLAREYMIPAVIATGNFSEKISNGQRLEVDGTRGVIRILGKAC